MAACGLFSGKSFEARLGLDWLPKYESPQLVIWELIILLKSGLIRPAA